MSTLRADLELAKELRLTSDSEPALPETLDNRPLTLPLPLPLLALEPFLPLPFSDRLSPARLPFRSREPRVPTPPSLRAPPSSLPEME